MTIRRWITVVGALAMMAACSDSGKKADTTTAGSGADTTVASTDATGTAPADPGLEGTWIVVRRITENRDYFTVEDGQEPIVQYRAYDVTCVDAECSQVSAEVTRANGNMSSTPFVMQFDGSTLRADETIAGPCLNAAGTALDGPELETDSTSLELAPQMVDGTIVSFVGSYSFSAKSEASADCSALDVGFTSDMVMFRPDLATLSPLSDGLYWGDGLLGSAMRAVHSCADNTCLLREPYFLMHEAGPEPVYLEGTLTLNSDGSYSGAVQFRDSCIDQVTSAWIADDAYDIAVSATVANAQVAGWDEPVLLIIEVITAQPDPSLPATIADQCPPYTRTVSFAGIPSQMEDRIDLTAPALGTDI